jgi:hypothetical protein
MKTVMRDIRAWALTILLLLTVTMYPFSAAPAAPAKGGDKTAVTPSFSPVVFSGENPNYNITLTGYGFGHAAPVNGDVGYFRVGDPTCGKVNPGACEAGYLGDAYTLDYLSWTNSQIRIGEYTVGVPGDAIEIGVWNPQEHSGVQASVWGGNIPPVQPGTPQISNVLISGSGQNLNITIFGTGFGSAPSGLPCTCDTAFLRIGDYAYHYFNGQSSVYFRAGFTGDNITLNYSAWSDTEIQITGFGGAYGQKGLAVNSGDPISIDVWSTNGTGLLATAWGGRVP